MAETAVAHRNEITVVGRVTSPATERTLPSGDIVSQWRVTVDRPGDGGGFDVVDCIAWTARIQRSAAAWQRGDTVEVVGAFRRRFWRTGTGLASRCEIEAVRARRLTSAVTRPRKLESTGR